MKALCALGKHRWVDARNKAVASGEVCLRCGAIRSGNGPQRWLDTNDAPTWLLMEDLPPTGGSIMAHRAQRKEADVMKGSLAEKRAGEPAPRTGRLWCSREIIGPPECPIIHRWTLVHLRVGKRSFGKLLLHFFPPNADDRAEHDHPASFVTLVLRGGYDDWVPGCQHYFYPSVGQRGRASAPYCLRPAGHQGEHRAQVVSWAPGEAGDRIGDLYHDVRGALMRPGMLRYRSATYRHRTRVLRSGCWTLLIMGPKVREWGFWTDGRWLPWREHERRFGFGMRCPEK